MRIMKKLKVIKTQERKITRKGIIKTKIRKILILNL